LRYASNEKRYQPIFRLNLCYIRSTLGSDSLLFFFLNGGSMSRHLVTTAILVIAFSLLGCGRKDAPLADAQKATVSQDVAQAKAALTAYIVDFWTHGDTTALARALSPNMIYNYNGGTLPGAPADHLKYLGEFRRAFPDLVGTVDQFTFAEGIGAAVTTWSGTHSGQLAGIPATGNKPIPPTGRKLSWAVNYLFRMEGGKIVELWEAWDEANTYLKLATSPQGK
jgi:predicted ester cyclase